MNLLSNMKIGQRLALGFAVVLGLSILITVIGILKLNAVADDAEQMLEGPIRKDRLITDWSGNIALAVMRTSAIIKSSDPSLATFFAQNTKETNAKGDAYLKEAQELLTEPEEKAAFERMLALRPAYSAGRRDAVRLKEEGKVDESNEVHDKVYIPASEAYQASMRELVKIQRERVSDLSAHIQEIKEESRRTVMLLGALSVAFGVACACG